METLTIVQRGNTLSEAPVHVTHQNKGLTIIDDQNSIVKVIIKGVEILGTIIDGSFGVNVINEVPVKD